MTQSLTYQQMGTAARGQAGLVGTVCLDTAQFLKHRRAGGKESPLAWEFAPVQTWEKAPDPGQVARRVIEGFTGRKLPDRWAVPLSTAMHWAYGSGAAALVQAVQDAIWQPAYPDPVS